MSSEKKIYADDKGAYGAFINFFVKIGRMLPMPQKIKQLIRFEIVSYIFIGGMTTVVNFICYYSFDMLKGSVPLNAVIFNQINIAVSWLISVIFAFFPNKYFCFDSYSNDKKTLCKEFLAFTLSRITTLLLEMGFMYVTTDLLHQSNLIMKPIAQIAVIIGNYIISKFFVFKKKPDNSEKS